MTFELTYEFCGTTLQMIKLSSPVSSESSICIHIINPLKWAVSLLPAILNQAKIRQSQTYDVSITPLTGDHPFPFLRHLYF